MNFQFISVYHEATYKKTLTSTIQNFKLASHAYFWPCWEEASETQREPLLTLAVHANCRVTALT